MQRRMKLLARALLIASLALAACGGATPHAVDPSATRASLLDRDRAFAAFTLTHGAAEGFHSVLAEDGIVLRGGVAVQGRETIYQSDLAEKDDSVLHWEPKGAEAASSGDLGYTWGTFTVTAKGDDAGPPLAEGVYVSMWRLQDGQWMLVLDTGTVKPHKAN